MIVLYLTCFSTALILSTISPSSAQLLESLHSQKNKNKKTVGGRKVIFWRVGPCVLFCKAFPNSQIISVASPAARLLITQSIRGLRSGWADPGRARECSWSWDNDQLWAVFLLLKYAIDQCTSRVSKQDGGKREQRIENTKAGAQSGLTHAFLGRQELLEKRDDGTAGDE